ncbi:MAG: hypothetical protein QNJ06_04035 [Kiloniellales bacterium]|nr:hypothetical protein [Kiloniellales bacterium]MDJ0969049.1 hypothetical protein [Kiloniellales bacterium]
MAEASPPSQPLRKLPVFEVVGETYGSFFRYLRYLPQAALLPVVLSVPLYWVSLQSTKQMMIDPSAAASFLLWSIPINLAFFAIFMLFYASWYRLCLMGPNAGRPPWFPLPKRRHWRLLGYSLLMIVIYLVIAIFGGIPVLIGAALTGALTTTGAQPELSGGGVSLLGLWLIFLFVLAIFVMLRLCFVFPAVAVDEDYALRHSWGHTKGQTLRLFVALLMTCLPVYVVMMAISIATTPSIFQRADPGQFQDPVLAIEELQSQMLTSLFVGLPLGLAFMALSVGTLAAAFKSVTGWYPGPDSTSPTVPSDPHGA